MNYFAYTVKGVSEQIYPFPPVRLNSCHRRCSGKQILGISRLPKKPHPDPKFSSLWTQTD